MRTTGEIIREIRLGKNMTAEKLAEEVGVTQQYVTAIENNKKRPSENFLKQIFEIFRFTDKEIKEVEEYEKFRRLPEEFQKKLIALEAESKKLPAESNARILTNEEFIDIPVRAKASAGNGYINLDECLYTMRIRKNGYHKDCYLIEVAGTSMSPLIEDGAFVIVDPHQTEYIKDKVYIVNYNEETYVKKVEINQDAGIMILKSVNPNFDSVYIPKSDSHLVKIMGRAVSFFFEGKL